MAHSGCSKCSLLLRFGWGLYLLACFLWTKMRGCQCHWNLQQIHESTSNLWGPREAKGLSWEGHRWCPHCDLEANSSTIPSTDNIVLAVFGPKCMLLGHFATVLASIVFFIIMYHNLFIRSKNMTLKTPMSLNIFWRFLDKELAIIVWTTFQWHSTPQKQQSWKIHLQKGGWIVSKISIFCWKLADLQNMNQSRKVLMND